MPTQSSRPPDTMATWIGPPEAFGMGVRQVGNATVLDLIDCLTWDRSAERLKRKISDLLSTGVKDVAVNLDRVTYMDSTGIGALLAVHNSIRSAGGTCRFFAPQEHIRHILKRIQLDKVLK